MSPRPALGISSTSCARPLRGDRPRLRRAEERTSGEEATRGTPPDAPPASEQRTQQSRPQMPRISVLT
eukprot:4239832-Pyramimonas_sp.AAC.1